MALFQWLGIVMVSFKIFYSLEMSLRVIFCMSMKIWYWITIGRSHVEQGLVLVNDKDIKTGCLLNSIYV